MIQGREAGTAVSKSPHQMKDIKIKTLYDTQNDELILQFEDERGPVFKAWFRPIDFREVCYGILDHIHDIELEKDRIGARS